MKSRREAESNYQRDFDYRRLYLPQLPRIVKNRDLDRYRQSLRTASEEYGHFWTRGPSNNTPLPPISAFNNHHPLLQPETGNGSAPDNFQMTSEWHRFVTDDTSVLSKPLLEAPHRPKLRRSDQRQTNDHHDDDDDDDDDVGPFRTRRDYDYEGNGRRRHVSSLASPHSRWGFRVAIDYAPPPLGVATDRLGITTVDDVIRVDLQMHLSGGIITLKDVPYTFVQTQR